MRVGGGFAVLVIVGSMALLAQEQNVAGAASAAPSSYVPVHKYVPTRDAANDVQQAISEARKTGKNIILEIGGEWCIWCHILEKFYDQNSDLMALRDRNFITVYIYSGPDNKNEKTLAHYPKIDSVPHFFVLDQDGTVLRSQSIIDLERDHQPSAAKMKDFFTKWSPHSEQPERAAVK